MTENGQTGDSINFSLNGTLPVDYELHKNAEMELNFIWPEALGYRNEGRRSCIGLVDVADRHNGQVLYLGVDWIYDPQINELHSFTFMICPKDGFVVIHIENKFLIASTDPNSEPSEILAFYKEYVR